MKPTWIINFSRKEPFGSFFDTYWQASVYNDREQQLTDSDKWFYCYDAAADSVSYEQLYQTARQLTADLSDSQPRLIANLAGKDELCVLALGDVTDEATIKRMHIWMAQLRQAHNKSEWTNLKQLRFYALLWTPQTANIEPGLSSASRGFLNELATLENLDINNRPFHKVVFFESSVKENDRKNARQSMEMAALSIALGHNLFVGNMGVNDPVWLNGGAAGTFYEAQVQSQQEAYTLSNLLLDKFCNKSDGAFVDDTEVMNYVDKVCAPRLERISPDNILGRMTANCPALTRDRFESKDFSTSSSWGFNYNQIWELFILGEIGGFKARLVNDLGWELDFYETDYLRKVAVNQFEYINGEKNKLEQMVFDIYDKDTRMHHVSIAQGMKVLDRLRTRIKQMSSQAESAALQDFHLTPKQQDAYKQAKRDHPGRNTAQQVMEVLEAKLKTLPAFNLSMFVRSLVLGALLGYIGYTYVRLGDVASDLVDGYGWLPYVAAALGFTLPILISLCAFFLQAKRINALKDQFVACRLAEMKEHFQDYVTEQVKRTYEEFIIYLNWLEKSKLEYLSRMLSAIRPADFTFTECDCFKPLLNYGISMRSEDFSTEKPLIPVVHRDGVTKEDDKQVVSGKFIKNPLLSSSPANKVNVRGDSWSLFELMNPSCDQECQNLCFDLMDEQVTIAEGREHTISFEGPKIGESRLLLLDFSYSMEGEAIEDLKDAVRQLSSVSAVEWIAFNDKVIGKSFGAESVSIDDLKPDGGTNFIPAINAAVEFLSANFAGQVVLVSDGSPFEKVKDILDACAELNQPLHTIYIGKTESSIMKQLAEQTGGEQITVSSAKELKENTIQLFQHDLMSEGGNFTFSQMLRKCRIDGCAVALYNYTKRLTSSTHNHMADLITDYGYAPGIAEWTQVSQPSCHLRQSASAPTSETIVQLAQGSGRDSADKLDLKLNEWNTGNCRVTIADTSIDMTAVMFSHQYVELQDFMWACFTPSDTTINDMSALNAVMQQGYPVINIYGKVIQ